MKRPLKSGRLNKHPFQDLFDLKEYDFRKGYSLEFNRPVQPLTRKQGVNEHSALVERS